VLTSTAASVVLRFPSAMATATPTPAPTPATVTIPVPVYQQSMVLDCETAALQQGLAYYGIFVSQPTLFAQENADTRLPVMGANHTVLRWGNPYTNFVGYVNGSAGRPPASVCTGRPSSTWRANTASPTRLAVRAKALFDANFADFNNMAVIFQMIARLDEVFATP
jgi:hypothetical protein